MYKNNTHEELHIILRYNSGIQPWQDFWTTILKINS